MRVFFDTEFTGLHKDTTLISIGMVSADGRQFYAELTDYDRGQVDGWLTDNVIKNLKYGEEPVDENYTQATVELHKELPKEEYIAVRGNTEMVRMYLTEWLYQFDKVEIWSDCLAYDWVLFNGLYGHAFNIPNNVHYIPYDICTLFKIRGIDPDISREEYVGINLVKHNALGDALIIKSCYEKLMSEGDGVEDKRGGDNV